jgi:superfamily I DNA/RNA helicase
VFWLDRHGTCPSKWARQAWQQEQERNLMYVAATRAQELLVDLEPAPKEAA